MTRNNQPDRKFAGLHFDDPWKEWLKGFKKREESIRDITRLSNEVWNYRNDLFPVRSIPVPTRPGYVTYDSNFFRIETKGKRLTKDLTDFFTEEHFNRDSISYGNAHDLGEFFELVLHEILVNGISIYAMEWNEADVNGKKYFLPISLSYVNPATVEFVGNQKDIVAKQKFSWIAKALNTYYEYENNDFNQGELVIFKHPTLYPSSPVGQSLRYLNQLRQWLTFTLWQGKANAEPLNHSLRVERARYQLASEYFKKQAISRVRVKRLFNQPVGGNSVGLTTYYELYAYAEYKKHLNFLRKYFVEQFNDQILNLVMEKNQIKSPLKLKYRGFATDEVIEQALKDFENRKNDVNSFLEVIRDDYNKALY